MSKRSKKKAVFVLSYQVETSRLNRVYKWNKWRESTELVASRTHEFELRAQTYDDACTEAVHTWKLVQQLHQHNNLGLHVCLSDPQLRRVQDFNCEFPESQSELLKIS